MHDVGSVYPLSGKGGENTGAGGGVRVEHPFGKARRPRREGQLGQVVRAGRVGQPSWRPAPAEQFVEHRPHPSGGDRHDRGAAYALEGVRVVGGHHQSRPGEPGYLGECLALDRRENG